MPGKYPNRIKACIHAAGYKVREITAELDIPERTMRDYLKGRTAMPKEYLEALAALLGCSTDDLLPRSSAIPSFWNVPHQRNPFFTGREALLEHLHEVLNRGDAVALTQAQAICGLGGIGKTQAVIEYAYRYHEEYEAIFWVKADTRENLLSDFVSIAVLLNLPEQHAHDQSAVVNGVMQWLKTHERWLLILDNADDLAVVRSFIPATCSGHLLLTTRAQAIGGLARRIEVETMTPEVGALFLLRRASLIPPGVPLERASAADRDAALEMVQELGGLPLALDQAGAYMEESSCSPPDYLCLYHKQRDALLSRRGGFVTDHPEPVATTWSLSFNQVERANPAAADLLCLSAFLDPDAIPEELIIKGAAGLGHALHAVATDPFALNEAFEVLRRSSLVRRNPDTKLLTTHRLVQATIQDDMERDVQRLWAERALKAVYHTFPGQVEVPTWQECQRCLPQALNCAPLIEQWSFTSSEATHMLNQAAYYLRERARYAEAESLFQQALQIREQVLGPHHLDTAQSLYNLGRLYFDQGRYAKAEPLYQRSLAIREQVLGPNHLEIARTLNSLALMYWAWGMKYEEAECLYQRALPIYEQTVGIAHPYTAHCMNNLALLYVTQERYTEAEHLHRRVLAIREKIFDPVHLDTAQSLQNLACLYVAQGKQEGYEEAKQLLERSLAIRKQLLGLEHPQTAKSLHNLALLYEAQGKYTEAEPLYQRALSIREKTLGKGNPKTLAAVGQYAVLLHKMQRHEEAMQLETRIQGMQDDE